MHGYKIIKGKSGICDGNALTAHELVFKFFRGREAIERIGKLDDIFLSSWEDFV